MPAKRARRKRGACREYARALPKQADAGKAGVPGERAYRKCAEAAKRGGTDKTPRRRIEWDTRGGCAGTARRTGRPAGVQAFARGRKELFHKLRGGFFHGGNF